MFRNRWFRRTVIVGVIAFVCVVAGLFYHRHSARESGNERLTAITAHLDATDPRWRLDDIEADRGWLNDDENSALLTPRVKDALTTKVFAVVRADATKSGVFFELAPNRVLDDEGVAGLDAAMAGNDAALAIARSFKDHPRGLRRYTISPDFIGTLLPHLTWTQQVCALLDADAERLVRDGRPGPALENVQAMLNTARSIESEPFLMCYLIRHDCDKKSVGRVERILGLTIPRGGLAEVQSMLLVEAESDLFFRGVKGERAGIDVLFGLLRNGRVSPSVSAAIAGAPGSAKPSIKNYVDDWVNEPYLPADNATYLESVTKVLELQKLPEHQQRAALKAIPVPPEESASRLSHLLVPTFHKMHDSSLRCRAQLRSAAAGIAAERFRQRHGRWPDSLAEIPRDILATVPLDPFDGKPLKYAKRPDGVTVYSIGLDEVDDGGNVQSDKQRGPGLDIGFCLYDVANRGLPPLPRPRFGPSPDPGMDDTTGVELGPPPRELDPR